MKQQEKYTKQLWVTRKVITVLIFLTVFSLNRVDATEPTGTTYWSANPTNLTQTVKDMIYMDVSYFFRLRNTSDPMTQSLLKGGIKGHGKVISTENANRKYTVSVYAYDPEKENSLGTRLYYAYALESDLITSDGEYIEKAEITSILNPFASLGTILDPVYTESSTNIKLNLQKVTWYSEGVHCIGAKLPVTRLASSWWEELSPTQASNSLTNLGLSPECMKWLTPLQPVIVALTYPDEQRVSNAKVPGLVGGHLYVENGKVVIKSLPAMNEYCSSNGGQPTTPLCEVYRKMRNPVYSSSSVNDIFIAQHRGYWGNNLGDAEPENTTAAVNAGFDFEPDAKIVEMDLTITKDNVLMMMHDYVMKRLTNYTGPEFSFDLTANEIERYVTRKRNEKLSNLTISRFTDVLANAVTHNSILMIDVKEQLAKMKGSVCVANCDFQTPEAQQHSWGRIVRQAIQQSYPEGKNKNLIVKTYYDTKTIKSQIGALMNDVMWTPMLVSNNPRWRNAAGVTDIQKMCDFIDEWHAEAGNSIACFETDFFNEQDIMLQPFSRDNNSYENLLQYIYSKTGRRSGIFSEEPAGNKGTVNRWGDWAIKNSEQDRRGDHLFLMNIPYANIMLITTDRIDVWKEIKSKF